MKPIKTKDTQGIFAGDMPYRFYKTPLGPAYFVTWKGTPLERIKFLFSGKLTTIAYAQTMPSMNLIVGEK